MCFHVGVDWYCMDRGVSMNAYGVSQSNQPSYEPYVVRVVAKVKMYVLGCCESSENTCRVDSMDEVV